MKLALGVEDNFQQMDDACEIGGEETRRGGTPAIRLVGVGTSAHDGMHPCAILRASRHGTSATLACPPT